jgi:cytochrome c-type biogenesis protein CcmE
MMTVSLKLQRLLDSTELFYYSNKMSKSKKEGKPKANRGNLVKRLSLIKKNEELLKQYK